MKYDKEEIIKLYKQGLTFNQISKQLGCTKSTVSYYCHHLVENRFTPELVEKYRLYYKQCSSIKETCKYFNISKDSVYRYLIEDLIPRSKEEITQTVAKKRNYRNNVKQKAVDYKGGCCQRCGYSKSLRALHFHHKDPSQKDFNITGGTKSFEHIKKELDKCELLCSNCHCEVHDEMLVDNLSKNIKLRF